MPIDTPDWVRDAVFYQIFPDRFATSPACPSRAPIEPGTPRRPTTASRAATCWASRSTSRTSRTSASPRCTSRRSSAPRRTTATTRTTTSRSTRSSAATTRCASCSTRPTRAGCGSSSTGCSTTRGAGSGPSTTSWRTAPAPRTATGSTSPGPRSTGGARSGPTRGRRTPATTGRAVHRRPGRRARGRVRPRPGLPRLVGAPGAAEAQHRQPGGPRAHLRGRRALAPVRHRRLAPGRADGDPRRGVLAGVPPPLPGRQPRGLHRRRDLARVPRVAGGRPLRRGDELPAGRRRSWASPRRGTSTRASSAATTSTGARSGGATGPRSGRSSSG